MTLNPVTLKLVALFALLVAITTGASAHQPPPFIEGPGSTLSLNPREPAMRGRSVPYGLQLMAQFNQLPRLRDTKCVQDSSYDRSGGNGDAGHFFRKTDNVAVLSDIKGPGCIYRFWSANANGQLRIYFDDEKVPTIDCPMQDLFLGKVAPFVAPIVGHKSGGWYCFFPMPFKKACRIEVTDPGSLYYHVEYQLYPDKASIKTFTPVLSKSDQKALATIVAQWGNLGENPLNDRHVRGLSEGTTTLAAGQKQTIAELKGSGEIRSIRMKLAKADRYTLRQTVLRVYWDGSDKPAIEAPIGDFFGVAFGDVHFKALPDAMTEDGGVCYWPMPYGKSARFEVENTAKSDIGGLEWHIAYQAGRRMPKNEGYFHAQWHRQTTVQGEYFHILQATGHGHYVGEHTDMQGDRGIGFLEGDEKMYVDGETFPSIYGTGTEDFYTGGWYFDEGPFNLAYHGCTVKSDEMSRVSAYRYQIQDCVPFQHDIKVDIEHGGENDYPGADYCCVAYWYQDSATHDWSPIDPAQLTPAHIRIGGAIEAETLTAVGGKTVIETDDGFPVEASGGKTLALVGEVAATQATPFTVPITAPADDVYRMHVSEILMPDSPPTLTLMPSGISDAAPVITVARPADASGRADYSFPIHLTPGSHEITLFSPPQTTRHVDFIRLEPSRKERGVIEAENLIAAAGPMSDGILTRQDGLELLSHYSPRVMEGLSGSAMMSWNPGKDGAKLKIPITASGTGDYDIWLGVAALAAAPKLTVSIDDGPSLGTVDLSTVHVFRAPANDYRTQLVRSGRITGLTKGAHTLVLTCVGAPSTLDLDYIRLNRSAYANSVEGESLRVLEAKDGDAQTQEMRDFGSGGGWSGGAQFWFLGRKEGAQATLALPVEKAGRYQLSVYYTTARDYAIVQVLIDGKEVGPTVDCYTAEVLPKGKSALGAVDLTAGEHRITFRAVGKNMKSSNYLIGVDAIALDPAQ